MSRSLLRTALDAVLPSRGQQDERQQAARLAGVLFTAASCLSLPLLPLLPASVDRSLAITLAGLSLLFGVIVPMLPWHRWPYSALHCIHLTGLAVIVGGGGFVGGSLDYYLLFIPLLFLFVGSSFLPRTSLWLGVATLGGFGLSLLGAQDAAVTPFVLLSLALAMMSGMALANGRQTERRTMSAMRHLLDAATSLGAASDDDEVGAIVAPILGRLVDADDTVVVLLRDGVQRMVGGTGSRPRGPVLCYEDVVSSALGEGRSKVRTVVDPDGGSWSTLVVPIVGGSRDLGALVAAFRPGRPGADRFAERMVGLLAAETGRVLVRLRATAQLAVQARTDALTGLGNRIVMRAALDRLMPGDAVVLCDMDHFKRVNDTHGHTAGDRVLVSFAACLQEVVRTADTAVRYGGEEFALVLPKADVGGAVGVLLRLRQVWQDSSPLTTFSAGVAIHPPDATPDETLERADLALYRAKVGGRDRDVVDEMAILGDPPARRGGASANA